MYDTDDPRAKAVTQTIAEQICIDMEPFDLVNKQGFQRTIKQLCPKYKMVSRPHISENVIPDMYCRVKNKVKNLLHELPHIIVTTDLWTAASSINDFISLTAHGLNENFELKTYCLKVFPFEGEKHNSENIAGNLRQLFQDWGINEQPSCNTNGSGTDQIKDLLLATSVTQHQLGKSSQKRKKIITFLVTCSSKMSVLAGILPCRHLSDFSASCENRNRIDYTRMDHVVSVLSYFEEATKSISQESACLSDAIPLINSLKKVLEQLKDQQMANDVDDNHSPEYSIFVGSLLAGINDRFRHLESDETYILSTALDPRYKLRTFSLQTTVESYIRCPNISLKENPKNYWRNENKYPNLKKLAQKYLLYQLSSVASERLFSTAGLIQNDLRNRLSANNLKILCFLNKNLPKVNFNYC
nr:unnamed protein product [Callosobruchus analis]